MDREGSGGARSIGAGHPLEAARAGDRAAIEAILRAHVQQVNAICRRLCADRGDAEDAAQEALLSIAQGLARFDGRSSLSSWIYRITTNACMDELRRKRRRPVPLDAAEDPTPGTAPAGAGSPEAAAVAADTRSELAAALAELPEDFRVAVVLRDVADLDYATIAETTGVAVGTVRSRIARGRARLADILAPGTGQGSRASNTSESSESTPGDPPGVNMDRRQ